MENIEFNKTEHESLLKTGYKFLEIIATGRDVETSPDNFRKEVILKAHKLPPAETEHYIIEIEDSEVMEMLAGNDTDIFYIQTAE